MILHPAIVLFCGYLRPLIHAIKPTYFAASRELLIGSEDGFIDRLKQPTSK